MDWRDITVGESQIIESSKVQITISVNENQRIFSVRQDESLLETLRNASFFSVKCGCDDGTCGVCTVLLNGKPVRSCRIKAADMDGAEITTLEGLSQNGGLHPIQEAFIERGGVE